MMRFWAAILAIGALGQTLAALPARADFTRVNPAATKEISAHGVCRRVKNNNNSPVFIPHRSIQEWATGIHSFLAAQRQGLEVSLCVPQYVYTMLTCSNNAGGLGSGWSCAPDVAGDLTWNNADGSCSTPYDVAVTRLVQANPPAYFTTRSIASRPTRGTSRHISTSGTSRQPSKGSISLPRVSRFPDLAPPVA